MYFDASPPRKRGDVGVLQSPVYTAVPGLNCTVSFFFHMHINSYADLSVWIKNHSSNSRVWSKAGDQGNNWNFGSIEISSTTPYQVLYSAGKSTSILVNIYTH